MVHAEGNAKSSTIHMIGGDTGPATAPTTQAVSAMAQSPANFCAHARSAPWSAKGTAEGESAIRGRNMPKD